ncbi:beta-propeller domain-containing protein [Nocardioides sp. zg-536]|uniref:Beta-propeller domain-containing protein n=1 Tax=Nocardioides faecalis TaxID=2803858 RepID=A0A938Y2B5_9ACTN|nr:beta-propeller domain-containing protein [Nocardioides faecalis]MBM9460892.1 beta-propeller domain-containing protein [Nocardioides faecalis]MBS4751867.1 beta-propeller domain-containing protein [Nocardioides faecalis]QVI59281.1 beta-propeller domain-containing protein [Nocardioides faecalis]
MSDLERLWDDYSPGPAPTHEILAAARTSADGSPAGRSAGPAAPLVRRRLLTRPALVAASITALVGSFAAGTLVGGSDDGSGAGGTPPGIEALPSHVAFAADLEPAASCEDLLASYVQRGLDAVGPWGWTGGGVAYAAETGDMAQLDGARAKAASPRMERQVSSETGTNVQESGVDEPDTVKTDGEVLVTLRDNVLRTYDVTGSATQRLATLRLPGISDAEAMLAGDTLVVVGTDAAVADRTGTRVLTVSLADPADPEVREQVRYSAALVSARQHGSTVRLVLATDPPDLDFVEPRRGRSEAAAQRHNRELVEATTIDDWLPTVTSGAGADPGGKDAEQLVDCADVALVPDELGLGTTSVVGFDVTAPTRLDAIGLAGLTEIAYSSADHLYLASSGGPERARAGRAVCAGRCEADGAVLRGGTSGTSYLFDFALDGVQATHVASGEVEGSIADRWSMDEADDVLRVAVGPTQETADVNAVVTLRREGTELVEHGRLDGLGRGEEIKSVRWSDDLAMVVTFRQVDPLYSVDLSDPARPRLLSVLKIPGFSSYLHPLGEHRMLGVGEGRSEDGWGAQVGLFDVTDTARVRRLDVVGYGRNSAALAGTDPRALTWLPQHRTVLTVISEHRLRRVGYVAVLRVRDGRLEERRVKVEHGSDVDLVRTVPLPDGRVVLVTGEGARFFAL